MGIDVIYIMRILYFSPYIINVIKSMRMRWAGHVAHTGRKGVHTGILFRKALWGEASRKI
jgi:hypothetical protein